MSNKKETGFMIDGESVSKDNFETYCRAKFPQSTSRNDLYKAAESALSVYLDAHRKAKGSPDQTPVSWLFLNRLGDDLKKVFPHHPELPGGGS